MSPLPERRRPRKPLRPLPGVKKPAMKAEPPPRGRADLKVVPDEESTTQKVKKAAEKVAEKVTGKGKR